MPAFATISEIEGIAGVDDNGHIAVDTNGLLRAERTLAWISKHRRCVRDYETRPDHHEAMVHIAMIAPMSRRLARSA